MYGFNLPRSLHTQRPTTSNTLPDRFWAKVDKAGPYECWLWHGAKAGKGYGTIYVTEQKRLVGAHVVSWFISTGSWPPPDRDVLHNCPSPGGDRPDCVNPAHLWLGTHQDNMLDKVAKGRDNTPCKVTKEQVLEMCTLYATGQWTLEQLAIRYGLTFQGIHYRIKRHNLRLQS